MSYARFSAQSDVYIYHHYMGFIECCACPITEPQVGEDFGFAKLNTAREAIEHLDLHRAAGWKVQNSTYEKIRSEYADLDMQIEPYEEKSSNRFEEIGKRLRDRAAYTQGVKDTEERIIKVLRDAGYPESTIALIKGENK